MKFVIRKVQLSQKYPYKYYSRRELLVGINPELDELTIDWIRKAQDIHAYGASINIEGKPAEYYASGTECDHCYIVLYLTDTNVYEKIIKSSENEKLTESASKLFPQLDWTNEGDKFINEYDDNIPKTYEIIKELWNK